MSFTYPGYITAHLEDVMICKSGAKLGKPKSQIIHLTIWLNIHLGGKMHENVSVETP